MIYHTTKCQTNRLISIPLPPTRTCMECALSGAERGTQGVQRPRGSSGGKSSPAQYVCHIGGDICEGSEASFSPEMLLTRYRYCIGFNRMYFGFLRVSRFSPRDKQSSTPPSQSIAPNAPLLTQVSDSAPTTFHAFITPTRAMAGFSRPRTRQAADEK